MAIYKQVYGTEGVFTRFRTTQQSTYSELFADTDSALLDQYALMQAGERTLLDYVSEANATDVVEVVVLMKAHNWKRVRDALTADYDVLKAKTGEEVTTGNDKQTGTGSTTDLTANKAYNSTDFVDSDRNKTDNTTDNTRDYTITKTTSAGTNDVLGAITGEVELRTKYDIVQVVLSDILKYITLQIYE